MSEDPSRRRLGRGLAALIGEMDKPVEQVTAPRIGADNKVPIEFVHPNPRNPRRSFAEEELSDLAQSIREHGVVQPVVVRTATGGRYEIIAGERRWRAAQLAGLAEIPVIIREVDDRVALELAIIENVQRSDLNPVEEALGYQQLIDEHNYTQADLGQVIGKSRSHVANTLRLLKLPDEVRQMLVDGVLSAGHARTLVTAEDPVALAKLIVEEGLSVRQAEALAQMPAEQAAKPKAVPAEKDADTIALEKTLSDIIGLKVAINHGKRGGELRIAYKTLEQLDEICHRLRS
ncbi:MULTISPECIES: ParB/RepB/Spo0J family partition protein [unclassified Aminobacter]|uniref:ParB/RepB/Spo0J family partition protein n=1 Tax=unclassified Aminobacter TaxID=2644704 RepID=UPI00046523EB|nr:MULTISPECIES: ParB/RepB/Spo0J family partition protein [unclassified Aminobacter]TWH35377.1 ParB family chromosome partitioning protein [Aminobacter sp. J15]